MNLLIKKHNLPDNIIYNIQRFLLFKAEFNKVVDQIDKVTHTIRYTEPLICLGKVDIYIPDTPIYMTIKLTKVYYTHVNRYVLSSSKPTYLCKECKRFKKKNNNKPISICESFKCHLLEYY